MQPAASNPPKNPRNRQQQRDYNRNIGTLGPVVEGAPVERHFSGLGAFNTPARQGCQARLSTIAAKGHCAAFNQGAIGGYSHGLSDSRQRGWQDPRFHENYDRSHTICNLKNMPVQDGDAFNSTYAGINQQFTKGHGRCYSERNVFQDPPPGGDSEVFRNRCMDQVSYGHHNTHIDCDTV